MNKKIQKIIIITLLVLLMVLGLSILTKKNLSSTTVQHQAVDTISIVMFVGGKRLEITQPAGVPLSQGLMQADKEGALKVSGKNYPRLGFLVTDIGDLHSGGGKYLFYYVNSKEASVGVSSYLPKNGDVIEWKLK